MPNHCSNQLTATGLTPSVGKALRDAFTEENFPNAFVQQPDWKLVPFDDGRMPVLIKEENGEERVYNPEGKADDRGYDWRKENWGTKWGAYDVVIGNDQTNEEDGRLVVNYLTAWTPINENCFAKISARFPDATFVNRYYEPGCEFVGVTMAKGGIVDDTCENSDVVRKNWERGNLLRIAELQSEHGDDEDGLGDALYELWSEDEQEWVYAFQETLIAGLTSSLEDEGSGRISSAYGYVKAEKRMNFTEFFKKRLGENG